MKITADSLQAEFPFIKLWLRYNIIMALFGTVYANQIFIENDKQIAKAVETVSLPLGWLSSPQILIEVRNKKLA